MLARAGKYVVGWCLLAAALACGCAPAKTGAQGQRKAAATKPNDATKKGTARSGAPQQTDRETWDVIHLGGAKVGHSRTQYRRIERDGLPLWSIENETRLVLSRDGQQLEQNMEFSSLEELDGTVREVACTVRMGPEPVETKGRVDGDHLVLTTTSPGSSERLELPWTPQLRGFFASEQTLLEKPLQPGERRSMKVLAAGFNQTADADFVAGDYETTDVLGTKLELLRIELTLTMAPGQSIDYVVWADRSGETLKTTTMSQTMYRTTREVALDEFDATEFDLAADTTVRVEQPIRNAHDSKQLRYRIHLDDGDPAAVFPSGPSQTVRPIDEQTAELTVVAIRPMEEGRGARGEGREETGTGNEGRDEEYIRPNNMVQSADATVMKMAREAAGKEPDPWKAALAIERYVHRTIREKNFSTAFATAAEVAKTREGDCTEHAVLLAALARAHGLPARAVVGLVYVESAQGFGFHMWNEVAIDGQWIAVDGTLAKGGIGAGHIKLADTSLAGASAYASFLPVHKVMGNVQIEVLAD